MLLFRLDRLLRALRGRFWSTTDGRERHWLLVLLSWPVISLAWLWVDRAQRTEALDQLSILLHEPRRRCRTMLAHHYRHLLVLEERRDRRQTPAEIRHRRRNVSWPDEAIWREMLARDGRSRIMAACHAGDYVHCLARLADAEPAGRDRIVMRQEPGSQAAAVNLREMYRQSGRAVPEIMLAAESDPLRLRQRLRRGGCTLTTFFDLPWPFGVPERTLFLGRPAWFCGGPARLAVSAGVPVIPCHVIPEPPRSRLVVAPAIDPSCWRGLGHEEAVRWVTRRLVAHLEGLLRTAPEHWRYLSVMGRYFTPPE